MPISLTSATNQRPSVYQARHQHLSAVLRAALVEAVQAGRRAAGGIGTISGRALATLYLILMSHPVDQQGRCRSCRSPSTVLRRRRRGCRVHWEASVWLSQPAEFVRTQLARELGLTTPNTPTVSPCSPQGVTVGLGHGGASEPSPAPGPAVTHPEHPGNTP